MRRTTRPSTDSIFGSALGSFHVWQFVGVILIMMMFSGCQVVNRYGPKLQGEVVTSRADQSAQNSPAVTSHATSGWSTADYVRFGILMQKELGRPHRATKATDRALDCSEFTKDVFEAYDGRQLPRTAAKQFELGLPVERRNISYGDLVFFITEGTGVSHVGIAVGFGEFMHVSEQSGVIVSSLQEPYWSQRFAGARRIVGTPK